MVGGRGTVMAIVTGCPPPPQGCEHIPTWISLSGDLAFSHQDGIYGFKFPKRFLELSQAKTSLYSLYLLY